MASGQGPAPPIEAQIQSSFPLPPKVYFERYSNEEVCLGTAPKPPEPIGNTYQMFGQVCHQDDPIIRPLESQNLMRLHPQSYDKRQELKKMSLSILCNFLDLLDILVKAADSQKRDEKLEDLNLLFIHIHHLINEFRPHQARETLKVLMERQRKQVLEVGERLWLHIEKAEDILRKCNEQLNELEAKHSVFSLEVPTNPQVTIKTEPMDLDSLLSAPQLDNNSTAQASGDGFRIPASDGEDNKSMVDKNQALMDLLDKIDE